MRLLALLLALGIPSWAAIAVSDTIAICNGSSPATNLTCTAAVTIGDLIVVGPGWQMASGGAVHATVDDTGAKETWTQRGSDNTNGTIGSSVWTAVAAATETITLRVTLASGTGYMEVMAVRVTGYAATGYIHETIGNNSASTQALTCGTFTRSGNEVLFMSAATFSGTNGVGWGTTGSGGTFTLGPINNNGSCCTAAMTAYQVVTSGTTYAAIATMTAAANKMTCAGVSILQTAIGGSIRHRVTQ